MSKLADHGLSMTKVEANQGTKVPPRGPYHLRVEKFSEGECSEKAKFPGALQYKVGMKVADESSKYYGRWIWDSIPLSPEDDRYDEHMGRLIALFLACGIPEDDVRDEDADFGTDEWAQRVIGCEVRAEVYTQKPTEQFPKPGNGVESYHEYDFDAELKSIK